MKAEQWHLRYDSPYYLCGDECIAGDGGRETGDGGRGPRDGGRGTGDGGRGPRDGGWETGDEIIRHSQTLYPDTTIIF